ncbi:unnamed protein product, partial [Closterium sp. NIES-53]
MPSLCPRCALSPVGWLNVFSPFLPNIFFPSPPLHLFLLSFPFVALQPPPPSPSPLTGMDKRGEAGALRWHGELLSWHGELLIWHGELLIWHGELLSWYAGMVPCLMSHVPCPMSHVSCLMSHVRCLVSHVPCLVFTNYVGKLPDEQFDLIMDLLFDKDKGIGLNLARYHIGGSANYTNSPQFLTSAWETRSIPGFRVQPNRPYDWTTDGQQRRTMLAALARNVDEVEAVSYSPPWWMTVNKDTAGTETGK